MSDVIYLGNLNKEQESLNAVAAFHGITKEYRTMIDSNGLLKNDFHSLTTYLNAYGELSACDEHTAKTIDTIISHLISETDECAMDEERMEDESSITTKIPGKNHRYRELKQALENFHHSYIKITEH